MPSSPFLEEALFRGASELPAGATRRVFLDEACADDPALRQRLEALLAEVIDPQNPEDAVRRQSLLDRAANILNSPEAEGRLTVDDKEVKAKIESLRGLAGAQNKALGKQP